MDVHLVDGTYELFRHFFAVGSHVNTDGEEVGAVRAVLGSLLWMLEEGATHMGVATDHVIESFRNELWPTYKSSAGIEPALLAQFPMLEQGLQALGIVVWPMTDLEADDALAAAARIAAADPAVRRVHICTADKDLGQSVSGDRVVQVDRMRDKVIDEDGVRAKFGVGPASIPDYLALVGDSSDGYPGLRGWGAKSAATVLSVYGRIEDIPDAARDWSVKVRAADSLAATLRDNRADALLFKDLATLRAGTDLFDTVDTLRWTGPSGHAADALAPFDRPELLERARALAAARSAG